MPSAIEWTDETWNFLAGCSPVSEGCRNCYAAKEAIRLAGNPNEKIRAKYEGTAEMRGAGEKRRAVFTGRVNVAEDGLTKPLRVRKPRRWFVNSMSDLFHPAVPVEVIDRAFAVMALCPQHTFQILTKRPERMAEYVRDVVDKPQRFSVWAARGAMWMRANGLEARVTEVPPRWPLPNVWLGTSVEDQDAADARIPHLLRCPAAVRFLSCEPLIGRVSFRWAPWVPISRERPTGHLDGLRGIHWVIVGGESGPGARPLHPWWVQDLRDQCAEAGVAFFWKQWGEWAPAQDNGPLPHNAAYVGLRDGKIRAGDFEDLTDACMMRVGKKAAGRLLDGVEHNAFPEVS